MKRFFRPNITTAGRVVRAVYALLLLAGAVLLTEIHWGLRLGLVAGALLAVFEALRGWCVVRACGIRTRI